MVREVLDQYYLFMVDQYLGQQTWMNPKKNFGQKFLDKAMFLLEKKTHPTNLPPSLAFTLYH